MYHKHVYLSIVNFFRFLIIIPIGKNWSEPYISLHRFLTKIESGRGLGFKGIEAGKFCKIWVFSRGEAVR